MSEIIKIIPKFPNYEFSFEEENLSVCFLTEIRKQQNGVWYDIICKYKYILSENSIRAFNGATQCFITEAYRQMFFTEIDESKFRKSDCQLSELERLIESDPILKIFGA